MISSTASAGFRRVVLFATGAVMVLSSCATSRLPVGSSSPSTAAHAAAEAPRDSAEATLLYDLLVGEIAGQRGAVGMSAESYLRAAELSDDPGIAERAAKIAVYAGENKKALQAALRWAALAPDDGEALQVVAIMYLRNGLPLKALPYLEKVRASHADQPHKGYMFVTQLLGREQNREMALQAMSGLVERHPDDPDALFAYAHLALRAEHYSKAHQLLDRVVVMRPGWSDAYLLRARLKQAEGDIDAAAAAYRKAIELKPDDLDIRISYARMLVEERRFEQAQQEFKRLEQLAPDNEDVLYALGLLALQADHLQEARRYFSSLVHNGQRIPDASFFLGRVAEMEKKDAEALRWYRKVHGGGNHFEAQLRIAILTARGGDIDGARRMLHELAQESPRREIRALLVESDILRLANRDDDAFEVLERALERHPDNPELLYAHAMAAERLGRIAVLERDLHRMLQADPDNAQALNALGYTLADRTDRYEEAYGYIQRAYELEPKDAAILDSMGWVLFRMGRYRESIEYLRKALDIADDAEIAAHLGEVLWVSGDPKEARRVWERARERHPDDHKLRDVMQRYLK